jgi:histidinol-phosphate aminotransferase
VAIDQATRPQATRPQATCTRVTPVGGLAESRPYVAQQGPPCDLDLSGNLGPEATSELLAELARSADPELLRRYPDAGPLEAALAREWGLKPNQVLVTAGADDALERVCRALLGPGRSLVLPSPSFEMLARYAEQTGAEVRRLSWPGGEFPRAEVLSHADASTSLVAVVSPNNPTGAVASADDLRALSEALPGALILLDAAYAEFAAEDLTRAALALPNALVTRTFSKAWGLAGLRVGYAMGSAEAVGWLRSIGLPYPVAAPSLELARGWLERGRARTAATVTQVRSERGRLTSALREGGLEVPSSEANFVLARGPRATWLAEGLAALGIRARTWSRRPELRSATRISCPAREEACLRTLEAIRAALQPRAILFDMDGVLVDVSGSYRSAIVATAASYGVTLDARAIAEAKAAGDANDDWSLTQRLLGARGVQADLSEVTERFEAFYQGAPGRPGLWENERALVTRGFLEGLGLPLGVVTGRPRADALRFLEREGLQDCFQVVIAREDAPALKPNPAPVRRALAALGVERAWLIGDTPDDLKAARAADVIGLGVVAPGDAAGAAQALSRAGAARVLTELTDLGGLL